MGTVMAVMVALMLVGVLVWGPGGHGMMGGHRDGHTQETTVEKESKEPCQQPDCTSERPKENINSEMEGQ
jgi:hypothetical protein